MQTVLILDRSARRALADFLEMKERPHEIPYELWRQMQTATLATISFQILGEIIDHYSYEVLDRIRWPLKDVAPWDLRRDVEISREAQ